MLATLASLGIGLCVDKVLSKAVSTAGMKVGEKIATTIGTTAISMAVGNTIDKMIEDAKEPMLSTAEKLLGMNVVAIEEEEAE